MTTQTTKQKYVLPEERQEVKDLFSSLEDFIVELMPFLTKGYEKDTDFRKKGDSWHKREARFIEREDISFVFLDDKKNVLNAVNASDETEAKITFKQYKESPDDYKIVHEMPRRIADVQDVMITSKHRDNVEMDGAKEGNIIIPLTAEQKMKGVRALFKAVLGIGGTGHVISKEHDDKLETYNEDKSIGITHFSVNDYIFDTLLKQNRLRHNRETPVPGEEPTMADVLHDNPDKSDAINEINEELKEITSDLKHGKRALNAAQALTETGTMWVSRGTKWLAFGVAAVGGFFAVPELSASVNLSEGFGVAGNFLDPKVAAGILVPAITAVGHKVGTWAAEKSYREIEGNFDAVDVVRAENDEKSGWIDNARFHTLKVVATFLETAQTRVVNRSEIAADAYARDAIRVSAHESFLRARLQDGGGRGNGV